MEKKKELTVNDVLLDKYINAGFNVMFHGKHGVGKTHMVMDAFERAGWEKDVTYKYFSAATMDPWIDFIGVPREMEDDKGPYLELVRPKDFRDGNVEAIFLDEYNRAPKKIRNAVMELIQFKSINGHKFPNLKVVWTAVNPDDGNYDTEGMDEAQKDRFQAHVEVPFKPDPKYFAHKFGKDMAEAAISWWKSLSTEVQPKVSPRRLDYALEAYNMGIELRGAILPKASNVSKLLEDLAKGPAERRFNQLLTSQKRRPMQEFLQDENNFSDCEKVIAGDDGAIQFCLTMLSPEKQQVMISRYPKVQNFVFANPSAFDDLIERVAQDGQNKEIKARAEALISAKKRRQETFGGGQDPFLSEKRVVSKYNTEALDNSIGLATDYRGTNVHRGSTRSVTDIEVGRVLAAKTTQQRMPILQQDLPDCVGVNMSQDEAVYALQILDYIASRSQETTITNLTGIDTTINTVIMAIQTHKPGITVKDLAEVAPYVMTKIVPILVQQARSGAFIFGRK
jgi:MoxR-like ATPase